MHDYTESFIERSETKVVRDLIQLIKMCIFFENLLTFKILIKGELKTFRKYLCDLI
jgi:hypothetical protein